MLYVSVVSVITQSEGGHLPECELLDTCPFFNDKMGKMPISREYIKKNYCSKNNLFCARFIVYRALGRDKVPTNLYPSEINKAIRLISIKS